MEDREVKTVDTEEVMEKAAEAKERLLERLTSDQR